MNKKIIKQLVAKSYTKNDLDEKTVTHIASLLKRTDLKQYLKALSLEGKKRTVIFESALPLSQKQEKVLEEQFSDKKPVFRTNKDLITGLKIVNNDVIYDFNLKHEFESIQDYLSQ